MNEQPYDNQTLTKYLLGALPAAETERFDELSFTNEEFAAALAAAENDLVDGFVQNELTGATLERFESHYLASPFRREKVKLTRAFQIYAEQSLAEKNETFAAQESKPKRTVGEIFLAINIFEDRNLIQWSFATLVLALVLAGGWWIVNKQSNQTEIAGQSPTADSEQTLPTIENNNAKTANAANENARNEPNLENKTSPPTENEAIPKQTPVVEPKQTPKSIKPPAAPQVKIASFILAPSLRSGSRISSLSLSEDITDVAMSLQLEAADYAAYRVRLMTESNASLWQSGNLKLSNKGENKTLNVRFPAKLLKSKIYFLQVSGIGADGAAEIISDYPFRIVRQ